MIIGLTGLARCGKDTVAEYLRDKYGYSILVFSDALRIEAKKRGIEPTKMNLSILGDELREKGGNAVLAKKLIESIEPDKDYVISGFRSPEEVYAVQNEVINFCLVCVDAEKSTRFKRKKQEDPQTEKDFFARDERDIENKGLGKVLEMADYTITNNGTLAEFNNKVEDLLKKIESE